MQGRANHDERQPLLQNQALREQNGSNGNTQKVEFDAEDSDNPQQWSLARKWAIVLQISMIAFFLPMASSLYAPSTEIIQSEYQTSKTLVLLNQTGFVCMLGIGPLFLAPMSETFGRRLIYLTCLVGFVLVQIPVALAPNIVVFVIFRTLSGFCASAGVGNGGGSISDMFGAKNKAVPLGFYFVFPLLAPTIGPLIGGIMVDRVNWRWCSWLMMLLSAITLTVSYFFLYETRALVILQRRRDNLEKKSPQTEYWVEGASDESILTKILGNSTRAVRILFTQPIVLVMSIYQALVFSTMYSLYAEYTSIWSEEPYSFSKTQLGLAYLAPGLGFMLTAIVIVLFIDRLYNYMARLNDDEEGMPEYRLPMANIGALLLPVSLFWFGWSVEKDASWPIPMVAIFLFGASQVSIFNTVQTYYIDAYTQQAASALAAGAFLRSMVGGIVPLFVGALFDKVGYGVGMSVFGAIAAVLMPAPILFYWYGRRLRERFPFKG